MITFSQYVNESSDIDVMIEEFARKSVTYNLAKEQDCLEFLEALNEFMIDNGYENVAENAFIGWAQDMTNKSESTLKRLYSRGVNKLLIDVTTDHVSLGDIIDICEYINPKDIIESFLLTLK